MRKTFSTVLVLILMLTVTTGTALAVNLGDFNPAKNKNKLWQACKREMNISMGCKVYRNALVPPYPLADDIVPYCLRHTYCTDLSRR